MKALEGLLLLDKRVGPTSHDLVDRVRRLTGVGRVGHAGTLDPTASGLLVLLLGRATRLARFLPLAPKRYEGRIRLGIRTTTDDAAGVATSRYEGPLPDPAAVLEAASRLRGPILQIPPAVSAKSVGGVRAYELARRGRPVTPKAVPVEIFRFELEPTEEPSEWAFRAEVSPGTYLRALARDLGEMLGCGGILSALRRTAMGPFDVSRAIPWPEGDSPPPEALERAVIPLEDIPLDCPRVELPDAAAERRFLSGQPCEARGLEARPGPAAIFGPSGKLLGMGELEGGRVRPRVVLEGPPSGKPPSV
jgi:tRNA pseudouridine55 synthase